ncbi:MAG: NUDIX domain-containing protein [Bacteroidetes bacterium]|jgi:ADP-ribose pyrophosphatase|nr:NUDIX domain-containing protein [Bacteroidota bacterium]
MSQSKTDPFPESSSQLSEKKLSSRQVYDGPLLKVFVDDVRLPDGSTSSRDWINHPGASSVVPVFEDGTIMLLKQYRYPPKKIFIEVPAGKLDEGETPRATAKRELLEETGIRCSSISGAGSFYPAIGYADEEIFVFVAWGLTEEAKNVDTDEFVLNFRVSFSQALRMIESGEISDAKTICSIVKARLWWEKNGPFPVSFT